MQEINNENSIIARILRGELELNNRDIKNLATADLPEHAEERFKKLAEEIAETVDKNRILRKEMKEKLETAEQENQVVKAELANMQEQIDYLKNEKNKLKYSNTFPLIIGMLTAIAGSVFPTLLVSLFTNSIWWLFTTMVLGFAAGIGADIYLAGKYSNKLKSINSEIKNLENERLELIEEKEFDVSKTQENERKNNIVRNIYKDRYNKVNQETNLNNNI